MLSVPPYVYDANDPEAPDLPAVCDECGDEAKHETEDGIPFCRRHWAEAAASERIGSDLAEMVEIIVNGRSA